MWKQQSHSLLPILKIFLSEIFFVCRTTSLIYCDCRPSTLATYYFSNLFFPFNLTWTGKVQFGRNLPEWTTSLYFEGTTPHLLIVTSAGADSSRQCSPGLPCIIEVTEAVLKKSALSCLPGLVPDSSWDCLTDTGLVSLNPTLRMTAAWQLGDSWAAAGARPSQRLEWESGGAECSDSCCYPAAGSQWSRPGTTPPLLPEKVNNQLGLTATAEQAGAAEPVLGTQCPIWHSQQQWWTHHTPAHHRLQQKHY